MVFALMVSENETVRGLIRTGLSSHDFQVLESKSLSDAPGLFEEVLPHVVVLYAEDLWGPEWMWIRNLREKPEYEHVAILVITPRANAAFMREVIRSRVNDVLLVPFDSEVVTEKLKVLRARLAGQSVYQFANKDGAQASFEVHANIRAISETGLQVSAPLRFFGPVENYNFRSGLFEKIGLKQPLLRFTNTTEQNGAISFARVQGWNEDDRKLLRHWVKTQKLETF